MNPWMITAMIAAAALILGAGIPAWALQTNTGLDNTPDSPEHERNLIWMSSVVIPTIEVIIRGVDPRFRVTSVYRSGAVNRQVGGSETSTHRHGLGVDFGGLGSLSKGLRDQTIIKAAQAVRVAVNSGRLPPTREVIAETWRNHLHVGMWPPGSGDEVASTRFLHWAGNDDWRTLPA